MINFRSDCYSFKVSLPVFEGLFGSHSKDILNLLFDLNAVHSFAKLRLHLEPALKVLDSHMTQLGHSLRRFKNRVCPAFITKELAKESGARHRKRAKDKERHPSSLSKGNQKATDDTLNQKMFSISTYKTHALGNYVRFISMFGTTDSYSMQVASIFTSNSFICC